VGGDFCGNLLKSERPMQPAVWVDGHSERLCTKPFVRFAMTRNITHKKTVRLAPHSFLFFEHVDL